MRVVENHCYKLGARLVIYAGNFYRFNGHGFDLQWTDYIQSDG